MYEDIMLLLGIIFIPLVICFSLIITLGLFLVYYTLTMIPIFTALILLFDGAFEKLEKIRSDKEAKKKRDRIKIIKKDS